MAYKITKQNHLETIKNSRKYSTRQKCLMFIVELIEKISILTYFHLISFNMKLRKVVITYMKCFLNFKFNCIKFFYIKYTYLQYCSPSCGSERYETSILLGSFSIEELLMNIKEIVYIFYHSICERNFTNYVL